MENTIFRKFVKYVSLNILGMIGISLYILADTYFVTKALGSTGIAALNLSISIYSVMHGIGLMIGIGGATRYSILKSQNNDKKATLIFSTSMKLGYIIGLVFVLLGLVGSRYIALALGADIYTLHLTNTYLRTILTFAPLFIVNNIMLAFVRNDNNPKLSMTAMLAGSFLNIILDYLFMFPLGMGMFGAAFATGFAPLLSISILLFHFLKKRSHFIFFANDIMWSMVPDIFSLGLSAFIVEVSSAVVLITFNLTILRLEGNLGVAAYGIIANLALVGIAIFTGLAQGTQPLISKYYGLKNNQMVLKVSKYALFTAVIIATIIYMGIFFYSNSITRIFNSEGNVDIARMGEMGLKIYFLGFFFAGINIVLSMCLSAIENPRDAFVISIARGLVIVIPLVLILSEMWNMIGVWFAFVLTELIVMFLAVYFVYRMKKA